MDTQKSASLRQLLGPALTHHRGLAVAWIVAIIASSAIALALPAAVGAVVSDGARGMAIAGLAAVIALLALATAARYFTACWFAESVTSRLRQQTYEHLLSLDQSVYQHTPSGELLSRLISDTDLIRTGISQGGTAFLRNLLTAAGATVMLVATSPRLAGVALVAVPLVVLPIAFASRRLRTLSRAHQDRQADLQARASEVLGAMATVQGLGREKEEAKRFAVTRQSSLASARRRITTQAGLAAAVIGGVGLAITLIVAVGADAVRAGELTGGALGQFLLYAFIAGFSSAALADVLGEVQRTRGGLGRVQSLLAQRPRVGDPENPVALPRPLQGEVRFENIHFSYPGRAIPAINGVTLTLHPGETVALVGPSGAGKSTLLQLLQRFYDPCVGRVRIDGHDIRLLTLSNLRSTLAVVPQHPVLFADTAADNIRYGEPHASDRDVYLAAQAAEADGFLRAFPLGYQTPVGVRGTTLSGGQQQRIAIARALIRNAPILLLDEATSALDAQSEQALQRAFDRSRRGRTTLVIAHRLATAQRADRIVVLDAGRIVAQGTHTELIAQPGLYADLARLQFLPDGAAPESCAA